MVGVSCGKSMTEILFQFLQAKFSQSNTAFRSSMLDWFLLLGIIVALAKFALPLVIPIWIDWIKQLLLTNAAAQKEEADGEKVSQNLIDKWKDY